jgi:pimeloyl-ACP methyl ester carboxylesterase
VSSARRSSPGTASGPRGRCAAAALAALLLPACSFFAPTVSVDRTGPDTVYESLNQNTLNGDELSSTTREVLHAFGLAQLADDEPLAALGRMHAVALREPTRANLFALAELAYHVGDEEGDRDAYLAAAVYAWLYLLGDEDERPPSPYDRRFRWACDLYNGGLQRAFAKDDGVYVDFDVQQRTLPVGHVNLTLDKSGTPWTEEEYVSYIPGDDYLIEGLSLRMRDAGLGVPLVGIKPDGRPGPAPATGFLRVQGGLADMADGIDATIELYSSFDARTIAVGEHQVPLESDLSIMLASVLDESPMWKLSLSGLFEGNSAVTENRLKPVNQAVRGRIPVVFVHGTASNPAYWADMFNTLLGDPELRSNMQFWFFQYASGNPIMYSAMTLRRELQHVLLATDPDGTDPALNQMILVGHSQGGLLVRLMISDGSLEWFRLNSGKAMEEWGFDAPTEAMVREAFDFKALPQVKTAIFLATPHRGSFLATSWWSRLTARFISLPTAMQSGFRRIGSDEGGVPEQLSGNVLPTALDNMDPDSPLLQRFASASMAPGVSLHSIVCVGDADVSVQEELDESDDGVVEYVSAHLDGVTSELLVNCGHSCQDRPEVIQEVRRILREHLATVRAPQH